MQLCELLQLLHVHSTRRRRRGRRCCLCLLLARGYALLVGILLNCVLLRSLVGVLLVLVVANRPGRPGDNGGPDRGTHERSPSTSHHLAVSYLLSETRLSSGFGLFQLRADLLNDLGRDHRACHEEAASLRQGILDVDGPAMLEEQY
jgi:hypothetical protein